MAREWFLVATCVLSIACAGGKGPSVDTDVGDTDGAGVDTDIAAGDGDTALFIETAVPDTEPPTPSDTSQPTDTDPPDAFHLSFGDLVLTEFMFEPSANDCAATLSGQYIELKNVTDHAVNLQNLVLRFGVHSQTVTQRVILQPGAYAVGRPDTTACVGYPPSFVDDFTYSTLVELMAEGSNTTLRLQRPDTILIDSVNYNGWQLGGPGVRVLPGHAAHLNAGVEDAVSNDRPDAWCSADEALGTSAPTEAATFGTPGRQAQGCASVPAP